MREALFTRIPQLREGRWRLLQEAVADWFPPLAPADGYSGADLSSAELRLARSLPHALSEWYWLAGRRADIWSRQDCLLAPEELMICADHLVFYLENQAVVSWGIKLSDLDLADPPVYVQSVDDAAIWIQENPTVSEFALQMFVLCIQFGEPLRWICGFPNQELSVLIEQTFPRLAFPRWSWTQSKLYGYRDIIIDVQGHGHTHVAARTAAAFLELTKLLTPDNFDIAASWEDFPY